MLENLYIQCLILYLCGSIPFGILTSKIFGTTDPRTTGSGNIGATNMLRSGGKLPAIVTLIGDALKAFIPLYLMHDILVSDFLYLAPVVGHVYPLWLKFKGGKGVAPALGVLFAFDPILAILSVLVFILTAYVSRYASLASLTASFFAAIYLLVTSTFLNSLWLFLLAILIAFAHRENIDRLLKGTEKDLARIKKNHKK